ncbi:hypothetical protein CMUS01_00289 [Colletotrichum musicola]|uniref:Uncharacterized protein n=1 Tax=Colletotrichum musicola TaxID=2175873 RepID=A0A8H6U915_9PEZI|nr:hypothetical protein CMUS01_00289 [Colletotrichum musicola]
MSNAGATEGSTEDQRRRQRRHGVAQEKDERATLQLTMPAAADGTRDDVRKGRLLGAGSSADRSSRCRASTEWRQYKQRRDDESESSSERELRCSVGTSVPQPCAGDWPRSRPPWAYPGRAAPGKVPSVVGRRGGKAMELEVHARRHLRHQSPTGDWGPRCATPDTEAIVPEACLVRPAPG